MGSLGLLFSLGLWTSSVLPQDAQKLLQLLNMNKSSGISTCELFPPESLPFSIRYQPTNSAEGTVDQPALLAPFPLLV